MFVTFSFTFDHFPSCKSSYSLVKSSDIMPLWCYKKPSQSSLRTQRGPRGVQTPHLNVVDLHACTSWSAVNKKPIFQTKWRQWWMLYRQACRHKTKKCWLPGPTLWWREFYLFEHLSTRPALNAQLTNTRVQSHSHIFCPSQVWTTHPARVSVVWITIIKYCPGSMYLLNTTL